MKKMFIRNTKYLLALLVMNSAITTGKAQSTAYARASATIVAPIGAEIINDFDFGDIKSPVRSINLLVTPTSKDDNKGGTKSKNANSTALAASFDIHHGNAAYSISTPNNTIRVLQQKGNEMMEIKDFTLEEVALDSNPLSAKRLYVGATLVVGKKQAPGLYIPDESFSVIINYN